MISVYVWFFTFIWIIKCIIEYQHSLFRLFVHLTWSCGWNLPVFSRVLVLQPAVGHDPFFTIKRPAPNFKTKRKDKFVTKSSQRLEPTTAQDSMGPFPLECAADRNYPEELETPIPVPRNKVLYPHFQKPLSLSSFHYVRFHKWNGLYPSFTYLPPEAHLTRAQCFGAVPKAF